MGTGTYTTGTGQQVMNVHPAGACEGRPCPIHRPSVHHMRDWPTAFRDNTPSRTLIERVCDHGVHHPDPDHLRYVAETLGPEAAVIEARHECDGCCSPPSS